MSKTFDTPGEARRWLAEQGLREIAAGLWEGTGRRARLRELLTEDGRPARSVVEFV